MDDDIDDMDFALPPAGASSDIPGAMRAAMARQQTLPKGAERWTMVYPVYVNSLKSVSDGRKVPKSLAVPSPAAVYLAEAAKALGLPTVYEPDKRHPRDPLTFGRIRVSLTGSPSAVGQLPGNKLTKKQLLVKLAAMVPSVQAAASDQVQSLARQSLSIVSWDEIQQQMPVLSLPTSGTSEAIPKAQKKKAQKAKKR